MSAEQALALLAQVAAAFCGTLHDHLLIQQALEVVERACRREELPVVEPQAAEPAAAGVSRETA